MNRVSYLAFASLFALACGGSATPTGSLGGACTEGGGCDPDLTCNASHVCESDGRTVGGNDGGSKSGVKRVFVTSTGYAGSFGGNSGADTLCNASAQAAQLGGAWVAWISAAENAVDHVKDVSPWYLVDGKTKVFGTGAQLRTQPTVVIAMDENAATVDVNNVFVWTGTGTGGELSDDNCMSFSSDSSFGDAGTLQSTALWTSGADERPCAEMDHLYCFEQ